MTTHPTPGQPLSDKPAMGPLSAGDWTKHNGSCVQARGQRVDVRKADGSEWLDWIADQWGLDWIWHTGEERAPSDIVEFRLSSLAPTAPVEASGSEDLAGKLTAIRDKFLIPTPDKDFTDYAIITRCIAALRPQPSGETREDAEVLAMLDDYADRHIGATRGEDMSLEEMLISKARERLSVRPLALGGQQGVKEKGQ